MFTQKGRPDELYPVRPSHFAPRFEHAKILLPFCFFALNFGVVIVEIDIGFAHFAIERVFDILLGINDRLGFVDRFIDLALLARARNGNRRHLVPRASLHNAHALRRTAKLRDSLNGRANHDAFLGS